VLVGDPVAVVVEAVAVGVGGRVLPWPAVARTRPASFHAVAHQVAARRGNLAHTGDVAGGRGWARSTRATAAVVSAALAAAARDTAWIALETTAIDASFICILGPVEAVVELSQGRPGMVEVRGSVTGVRAQGETARVGTPAIDLVGDVFASDASTYRQRARPRTGNVIKRNDASEGLSVLQHHRLGVGFRRGCPLA
jgi:hypothetical protein